VTDTNTTSTNEPALGARFVERTFMLDDISIRSDGEGRTVVAYAAAFDKSTEVTDQDGHYFETINRSAFDKTLQDRSGRVGCFYNHGKTLYGTPSERFSLPLGTPEEIRPDGTGLLTVTRYNKTPLADEVLESIRNGDIKGQSWSGRFMPGRSQRSRGTGGGVDTIVRSEIALKEYGPTPIPVQQEARILGVRTEELDALAPLLAHLAEADADAFRSLYSASSERDREVLYKMLGTSRAIGTPPPAADAAPGNGDASATNGTPATGHLSGPSQEFRQRRARALALALKGPAS